MITTYLPQLAAPRKRMGSVWDFISPSRLNLWLKCPLAYRLRYIDGIKTPTTPTLFLGQRVHDALETHYRHRQLGAMLSADEVVARINGSWGQAVAEENVTFASASQENELRGETERLVRTYLSHVGQDEPLPLAVETSLQFPLIDPESGEDLGIPLLGVVDLIFAAQQGPVICDFKTAAKSSAPLEVTHEVQLSCYAYLFRHMSGEREVGLEIRSLVKTKTPKILVDRYPARTEVHIRRLLAVVRAYLDDLDARRFVYRPSLACSYCDYENNYCRAWQE